MTFTLISVVYACGIAKPGHGSMTPLAVGLSLTACAGAGAKYTGAALNPARVLGPLAVFKCGKDQAWVYILGEHAVWWWLRLAGHQSVACTTAGGCD
jgi:aquaporin TIP